MKRRTFFTASIATMLTTPLVAIEPFIPQPGPELRSFLLKRGSGPVVKITGFDAVMVGDLISIGDQDCTSDTNKWFYVVEGPKIDPTSGDTRIRYLVIEPAKEAPQS